MWEPDFQGLSVVHTETQLSIRFEKHGNQLDIIGVKARGELKPVEQARLIRQGLAYFEEAYIQHLLNVQKKSAN